MVVYKWKGAYLQICLSTPFKAFVSVTSEDVGNYEKGWVGNIDRIE